MNPLKENLLSFFKLSPKEKKGMLCLIPLILLVNYFPYLKAYFIEDISEELKVEIKYFKERKKPETQPSEIKVESFFFDPNTADENSLKLLGLPNNVVRNIVKYRKKGGTFFKAEDFARIYGMNDSEFERLKPFIRIEFRDEKRVKKRPERDALNEAIAIEINSTDSASLTRIKGIGPVYASRIIKYRNLLGGFYSPNQISEVYGINDSLADILSSQLSVDSNRIEKLDINEVDINQLRKHPYLRRYKLASTIVKYRKQHGNFISIAQLKNIHLITDSVFGKISPYLVCDDRLGETKQKDTIHSGFSEEGH